MSYKRLAVQLGLVLALAAPVVALAQNDAHTARANEPSIDEIYKAASSGRLADADAMIDKVLAAHPTSAKAHFVHAELLAKEGKLGAAKSAFAKANELAPGLPFAKPEAVAGLSQRLDSAATAPARAAGLPSRTEAASMSAPDAPTGMGTPAKLGILAALLAAGVFMYRRISGVRPQMGGPGNMNGTAGYATPSYANGPTGYAPPMNPGYAQPPAPAAGGWTGGGLGGALMTGAAVGLGAVAVEEAVRHFSHGNDRPDNIPDHRANNNQSAWGDSLGPDVNADMGGNDFGIADSGSWDSGGGDGGSDW